MVPDGIKSLGGDAGNVSAVMLALPSEVVQDLDSILGFALWFLQAEHLSPWEPAPFLFKGSAGLEFVSHAPLGIYSGKEDTFRKLSSQEWL